MEPPETPTSKFFYEELSRAVEECGFGILAWELEDSPTVSPSPFEREKHPQANAVVTLLSKEAEKGDDVHVRLTLRGYEVVCRHPVSASSAESTTVNNASTRGQTYYETLDDLLVAVSPVFAQRRQRLLFAKLEEVAKTRSWDVVEEEPSQEERGKKTEED